MRASLRSVAVGAGGLALVVATLPPSVAAPTTPTEVEELAVPAVPRRLARTVAAAGPRVEGTVVAELSARATGRFSTIGVTWAPGSIAPQTEVRVRRNSTWSPWQLLEDNSAELPDGTEGAQARPGTAPVWVGDADGVQVRLLSRGTNSTAAPRDVKVALVDPQRLPLDSTPATVSSTGLQPSSVAPAEYLPRLYPAPSVVSRRGWGADESLRSYNGSGCATPRYGHTIQAAIVHHTAGANSYSATQSAAIMRGIYAYHVKSQGWCDIGYNFLVDKYGTIFEGRYGGISKVVHGAHATLWNTNTVGISMMGNFETGQPTDVMINSVAKVLAWKLEGFYRSPTGRVTLAGKNINVIAGHGDVMSTACPGRNMISRMDTLRGIVARKVGSFNTPIYRRWQALGGETGWLGSPVAPERVIADGRITRFAGADLLWSPTTGTHWVAGATRVKYRALGDATHYLGFPVTDEGAGPLGSRVTRFQSGAIYASTATGAVDVYRSFADYYDRLGDSVSRLGLPTASQRAGAVPGSQVQSFQHGRLYWSSALRTQEVNGPIFLTYRNLGAEGSRLGLPTRGDYAVPEGRATDFQGGRIVYRAATGTTTVTYF